MSTALITREEIEAARLRGAGIVMETPVLPTVTFSEMCGRETWLKCENLQRAGSFKIRGAMNAVSLLDESQRVAGVVAASRPPTGDWRLDGTPANPGRRVNGLCRDHIWDWRLPSDW